MSGYDVVGDIHAQGERLEALLKKLGYQGLKHPEGRKIIFLGDFIDRGTEHAKILDIVRRLMDAGTAKAVMGNHEFNAICYARKGKNGYIRPHTPQNTGQQALFLAEFPFKSPAYKEVIKWFETLPVFIDLPDIAIVHACWNRSALNACKPFLTKKNTLKKSAYAAYDRGDKRSFINGLEISLKGPEFRLPPGVLFTDVSGDIRRRTRLLWWSPKDAPPDAPPNHMVEKGHLFEPFHGEYLKRVQSLQDKFAHAAGDKPVFIGHYNIPQIPFLTADSVACVNFKTHLVAYRWNEGDTGLDAARLVHI